MIQQQIVTVSLTSIGKAKAEEITVSKSLQTEIVSSGAREEDRSESFALDLQAAC